MRTQQSRLSNRRPGWMELDEHEIGRPHLRLKNPIYPIDANGNIVGLEVLGWELYDYYECVLNTTLQKETMFSISLGQQYTPAGGVPFGKTLFHTNMQGQGGVLPNPQKFMVKGLAHIVDPATLILDFRTFEYQTQYTFQVGDSNKVYSSQLIAKVPSASGISISGIDAVTAAANLNAATQGWPVTNNLYSLLADGNDPGVELNQGQQFGVVIDPTLVIGGTYVTANSQAGGVGLKMWFSLVGALTRSVQ